MTVGMGGYVVNDALIKLAAEDLPLFESIFIRGLFITTVLVFLNARRGHLRALSSQVDRPLAIRVSMEAIGTALYLSALTRLPLAGLTAVLQVVPLIVTFVAARLLRESVNRHRVIGVLTGFVGVMLVVRPGSDDFNPWFLAGILVVATIVVREVATTRISTALPSLAISLCTSIVITTMGGLASIVEGWDVPTARQITLLGAAGGFLVVGYTASVITVRTGDLSFSAPFRYTVMVFAIILQIVVFGEVPDGMTFVGTAIIAAAGIATFRRERADRTMPPTRPLRQ